MNPFIKIIREELQNLTMEERWALLFQNVIEDDKEREKFINDLVNESVCKLVNDAGKLK